MHYSSIYTLLQVVPLYILMDVKKPQLTPYFVVRGHVVVEIEVYHFRGKHPRR